MHRCSWELSKSIFDRKYCRFFVPFAAFRGSLLRILPPLSISGFGTAVTASNRQCFVRWYCVYCEYSQYKIVYCEYSQYQNPLNMPSILRV